MSTNGIENLLEKNTSALSDFIHSSQQKMGEVGDRLRELEQKSAYRPGSGGPIGGGNSLAQEVMGHANFAALASGEVKGLRLRVGYAPFETKNTIVGSNTLVPADRRPELVHPMTRALTLRDLMAVVPTASSSVEITRELVFTNSAGPQTQAAVKPESALTFELKNYPVVTLAHWLAASRQVLSDQPMLEQYINTRLIYGLALEEEREFFNGTGAGGELSGLLVAGNHTVYSRGATADTKIDCLRKSMTMLQINNHSVANAIILHPADWEAIELLKTTQGEYLTGNARLGAENKLWGVNVIPTVAMNLGSFITADLANSVVLFQRQETTVEISTSHSDFFTRNLCALLAEERLALAVTKPLGIIYGSLP